MAPPGGAIRQSARNRGVLLNRNDRAVEVRTVPREEAAPLGLFLIFLAPLKEVRAEWAA